MAYGTIEADTRKIVMRNAAMKVEIVGIGKEDMTFVVDGRKVEVPCETKIYDPKNSDDIVLCFYPKQSIDKATNQTIGDDAVSAIIEYIKKEFIKDDGKYEINMAG